MKINEKVLIIPPYISTSWKNVNSLFVESKEGKNILIDLLNSKSRIEIPNLDDSLIASVFEAHGRSLDMQTISPQSVPQNLSPNFNMGLPLQGAGGIEMIGNAMQHNPDQASAPDPPEEVLSKIVSISKIVGIDDPDAIPKAEPHCNCVYCQIAKALNPTSTKEQQEELIFDEELSFRSWDIKQAGENLYLVSNPLEKDEQYQVFLGDPIGCTCGNQNCDHIKAVLKS